MLCKPHGHYFKYSGLQSILIKAAIITLKEKPAYLAQVLRNAL